MRPQARRLKLVSGPEEESSGLPTELMVCPALTVMGVPLVWTTPVVVKLLNCAKGSNPGANVRNELLPAVTEAFSR